MKTANKLVFVIAVGLSLNCAHQQHVIEEETRPGDTGTEEYDEISEPEYKVVSVVLNDIVDAYLTQDSGEVALVLVNLTALAPAPPRFTYCAAYMSFSDVWPNVKQETFNDFVLNSQFAHLITRKLDLPFTYELLSIEDDYRYFEKGESGWDEFYKDYPEMIGITEVSRPGFNQDSTEALVYTGRQVWDLYGYGYYYLLTKVNGKWEIKQTVECWVS